MKKVVLIAVSLLFTLCSYSQEFARVVKSYKSQWTGDDWKVVGVNRPSDLFVVIKDWDITIGDYKFRTYDDPEKRAYDTHVTYSWKCVNGEGKKCTFVMKKFKPSVTDHIVYMVIYDTGIMYEYEVITN